ncbi:hypothetical protein TrRE_jg3376 [Triparma retinervis]|uniref:Uncharacterized protein n=1 Tax=Triparma retinervis TaxID=2557542 RepID=A0A9W7AUR7_9STRA|nr:hypothetical protein TrRE_jg3376 [Triparma retinervis]
MTAAQISADEFLTALLPEDFTVIEGTVSEITFEAFVDHCKVSPLLTRQPNSMQMMGKLLDSCVDKNGKWEEMSFVDPVTQGTQFMRTLKAVAMLGDLNMTNLLMKKDGKAHREALLGACSTDKPDIVTLILNHTSLKLDDRSGGLPLIFVEACSDLSSADSIKRLLRIPSLKLDLRKLCDINTFGEMYTHRTVLEHALINGIHCCKVSREVAQR